MLCKDMFLKNEKGEFRYHSYGIWTTAFPVPLCLKPGIAEDVYKNCSMKSQGVRMHRFVS